MAIRDRVGEIQRMVDAALDRLRMSANPPCVDNGDGTTSTLKPSPWVASVSKAGDWTVAVSAGHTIMQGNTPMDDGCVCAELSAARPGVEIISKERYRCVWDLMDPSERFVESANGYEVLVIPRSGRRISHCRCKRDDGDHWGGIPDPTPLAACKYSALTKAVEIQPTEITDKEALATDELANADRQERIARARRQVQRTLLEWPTCRQGGTVNLVPYGKWLAWRCDTCGQ